MTAHISATEHGELQGALGSIQAIVRMIGPCFFSFAFAQSISLTPLLHEHIPAAPFFRSAFLLARAVIIAARTAKRAPGNIALSGNVA